MSRGDPEPVRSNAGPPGLESPEALKPGLLPLPRRIRPRRVHDWEERRSSTWLELFFDLVFVVAIARLAKLLHDDHSVAGILTFVGLLATIWWAWISFSYFADLFDDDSALDRIAQLAAMLGAAILAVALGDGVAGDATLYAGTFAAMFCLLAALYAHAGRGDAQARELCRWYVAGSLTGAALWALSIAVPVPGRYGVWALAIVANALISGPIAYARMSRAPQQVSHMPERFGLFVIVVLGEAVLAVVTGITETDWRPAAAVVAVAGFLIASSIWWLYFDGFDEAAINRAIQGGRRAQVRSFVYGYGHLLIYAAVAGSGVAVQVAAEAVAHGEHGVPLLGGSLAALLAGFLLVSAGVGRDASAAAVLAKIVLAAGGVALSLSDLPVALTVSLIALGWVGLVALEGAWRRRGRRSDGGAVGESVFGGGGGVAASEDAPEERAHAPAGAGDRVPDQPAPAR